MQIGILGLLGVVFVTLKLCGVIAWSWWLVLLPFYGVAAALLLTLGVAAAVMLALKGFKRDRR